MMPYEIADLRPMTCKSVKSVSMVPGLANCLGNPKLDGFRLVCAVEEDKVAMMSRGDKFYSYHLPYLTKSLKERFPVGTVLDGEICGITFDTDGNVTNNFEHVQSIMLSLPDRAVRVAQMTRPLSYYCFDMLELQGEDLRHCPLSQRYHELKQMHDKMGIGDDLYFILTPFFEATEDMHRASVNLGFEGTVMKDLSSPYLNGMRGHGWYKIKHKHTMDVIVVGFCPGKGKNRNMVGSLIIGQPCKDQPQKEKSKKLYTQLIRRGKRDLRNATVTEDILISDSHMEAYDICLRGTVRGFDDAMMMDVTLKPERWLGRVIEISHNGRIGKEGKVRHPEFERTREDRIPEEVTWHDR